MRLEASCDVNAYTDSLAACMILIDFVGVNAKPYVTLLELIGTIGHSPPWEKVKKSRGAPKPCYRASYAQVRNLSTFGDQVFWRPGLKGQRLEVCRES